MAAPSEIRERLAETYQARSDSGEEHIIYVYERIRTVRLLRGGESKVPLARRLALKNGAEVNAIDDHTFEIVHSGEIIRRQA